MTAVLAIVTFARKGSDAAAHLAAAACRPHGCHRGAVVLCTAPRGGTLSQPRELPDCNSRTLANNAGSRATTWWVRSRGIPASSPSRKCPIINQQTTARRISGAGDVLVIPGGRQRPSDLLWKYNFFVSKKDFHLRLELPQ